jgi:hypothetical protein
MSKHYSKTYTGDGSKYYTIQQYIKIYTGDGSKYYTTLHYNKPYTSDGLQEMGSGSDTRQDRIVTTFIGGIFKGAHISSSSFYARVSFHKYILNSDSCQKVLSRPKKLVNKDGEEKD